MRGIYHNFGDEQRSGNFFGHSSGLTDDWYKGTTGIDPLDHVIQKTQSMGWAHHIERLMVVGNLMNLARIHPQAVHQWFMEMYVDSAHWVMGPNVYGMALFSDGGIFATKPYICGSSYIRKMGDSTTIWMIALWINFAASIRHSLNWIRGRYALGLLFGGIGGPLAYLAGETLGLVWNLRPVPSKILEAGRARR